VPTAIITVSRLGPRIAGHRDREQQARHRQEHVDDPHQERVDAFAPQPAQRE
jgi:hypothetical protein